MSAFDPKGIIPQRLGALEELGPHEGEKQNCRHAEEGQLTQFKVRVVMITS